MSLEVPVSPRSLVRTDGTLGTEQAVSLGLGLARTDDRTVHALYVTDGSGYSAVTDARAWVSQVEASDICGPTDDFGKSLSAAPVSSR